MHKPLNYTPAPAGIVYGFNVDCPETVKKLARSKGVSVRAHNIIYKLMDDIREELTSRLPPKVVEEVIGGCSNCRFSSPLFP